MQQKFKKQLQTLVIKKKSKILLAVSGGVDSMVLFDLLCNLNIEFEVAHCNFSLRHKESDEDQFFIENICKENNIKLHLKKINTKQYARKNKMSIQMAARKIRYEWFRKLTKQYDIDFIFTAHHADDSIETFFINLIRGSGVKGLKGIQLASNDLIRPLINFSKSDLYDYANKNKVEFREDSSNLNDYYVRNKIRNKMIPLLESINPGFKFSILKTIQNINTIENIYSQFIAEKKKSLLKKKDGEYQINISVLLNELHPKQLLYEIISDFGFSDIDAVFGALNSDSGREFFSLHFYMVKDRENLIISKNLFQDSQLITETTKTISQPYKISFKSLKLSDKKISKQNYNQLYLDYSKLTFPLLLRPWVDGDRFIPLGMKNFKKISDYFIDKKFSLIQKKKALLLISNGDIICIINERIDDRYKLVENSKKVYIVST